MKLEFVEATNVSAEAIAIRYGFKIGDEHYVRLSPCCMIEEKLRDSIVALNCVTGILCVIDNSAKVIQSR